ncbi:MAG: Uncharacterised protein [Methanobacteriota archaeon]|nr:MAG: Uncharacterised protein [Euryarchaeota archaeon]
MTVPCIVEPEDGEPNATTIRPILPHLASTDTSSSRFEALTSNTTNDSSAFTQSSLIKTSRYQELGVPPASDQLTSTISSPSLRCCVIFMSTRSQGPVPFMIPPWILTISSTINQVPFTGLEIVTPSSLSLLGGGVIITPLSSNGVQFLSKAMSTAHEPSINPNPHLVFHLSETSDCEALPLCSEEFLSMSFISSGVKDDSAWSINATTPDTSGAAIEVPSLDSYPSSANCLGEPGNEEPVAAEADIIPLPNAVISGFNSSHSSSSLSVSLGPQLE